MARTLYGKLGLAFLVLVGLGGLLSVVMTLATTRLYLQEVNQRLNRDLAAGVVKEVPLLRGGEINQAALEDVFHMLMVVNPAIEIYLLDPEGRILGFSAPPGKVKRETIPLAPVEAFLAGERNLPIRGADHPKIDIDRYLSSNLGPRTEGFIVRMIYGDRSPLRKV